MRKRFIFFFFFIIFLGFQFKSIAQFTPEELAERGKWEDFLRTAEIVGSKDIPEGVTKPVRVFLKKGDVEESGAWKKVKGVEQGFLEGWQYEIAAYEMDKLLGLNMVPPTVEREFKGEKGSLQLWIELIMSDLERMERNIKIPPSNLDNWSKMKYLMRAFDSLIANEDRTQQNIRYAENWRIILIDHSRSFRSSKKFTKNLVYGKNGIKERKLFKILPRTFVENVRALNFDDIKKAVGPYLEDKEIKAILTRKVLLLKEIDEMIKDQGEDKVLY